MRGRVWPVAPAAHWGAGTPEWHEWGSVLYVPSVSRGVINNHCSWTSRTSRYHGTPRTSRDSRSVCLLVLPPVNSRLWMQWILATFIQILTARPGTGGREKRGLQKVHAHNMGTLMLPSASADEKLLRPEWMNYMPKVT